MKRRAFILGLASAAMLSRLSAREAPVTSQRVEILERELAARRDAGRPLTARWINEALGSDLDHLERRISTFELVRNVPYKLTGWKGHPDSLFNLGQGDCRHKSAAMIRLTRDAGGQARPIQVPFDWADLPIPPGVLSPLSETRGINDSVEVEIGGRWVLVDPTWDVPPGKV